MEHAILHQIRFGLLNKYPDTTKRTKNIYGQNKWEYVKKLNQKIPNWKPTLDKISWQEGYSVHSEGADYNYISDIKSLRRNEANGYTEDSPCSFCDPTNERYWEMGFFDPDSTTDKSKYFIMVNRRCVPDTPNFGQGDLRNLKIKFDSTELPSFRNWKVIDLNTYSTVRTFDKDSNLFIDMGIYQPGEGKLYKLAPVMQEGGTLVANEEVNGTFNCNGEVNNNGKNITLKPATTINFTGLSARINMSHGSFKSGYSASDNTSHVYLTTTGNFWKGLMLNGCDTVKMINTFFRNVAPYSTDSAYAAELINCTRISFVSCNFASELDLRTGCIRSSYVSNDDADYSALLQSNTFDIDQGGVPAVSFISAGGLTFPLIIDGNTFTTASENSSSNAVFLCNINGGVIKNNNISDYTKSIILLSSSMDLYNNTISSSIDNSEGILVYAMSNAILNEFGNYYTAGFNNITNYGDGSRNIELTSSYFNIYKGQNTFNVEADSEYHFTGSMYESNASNPAQNGKLNCFQFNGSDAAESISLIWDNTGDPVDFTFTPYSCNEEPPMDFMTYNFENGINDTIYYEGDGSGGGKGNYELRIDNYDLRTNSRRDKSDINNKEEITEITSMKSLADSIGINIRRRDYLKVYEDCMNMLTNYSDSLQSTTAISKLYLAGLRLDSSGNKIEILKTFLETLILNNPNNAALVKQSFYFIQKCKVSLKQYESAMAGFQDIIDENPYSYEGLVASWDYAATSLLFESEGGTGGGISNFKIQMLDQKKMKGKTLMNNPKFKIPNPEYSMMTHLKSMIRKFLQKKTGE
jgi:hypothetical protein